ncbi:hypothetical protein OQA88_5409 [Cercophora sp. LCS_1]
MGIPLRCLLPILGAFSVFCPAVAATSNETTPEVDMVPIPQTYMVEFVEGFDAASFYTELARAQIRAAPRLNLTYTLYKGSSFVLDDISDSNTALSKISAFSGVKSLWPVNTWQAFPNTTAPSFPDPPFIPSNGSTNGTLFSRHLHKRQSADDTYSPHVMTQVDKLRARGITGKGIRIAVIDSGIDYKHPALGGCFGPGCLVSYGTDFFGDSEDHPVPDDDPIDCNGHGTHVAGIIAAQPNPKGFTGAAPGVTLGAYKVARCISKQMDSDIVIAAFNRAFDDGSHIINLSGVVGGPWNEDPVAVAVQRIVDRGVPCVTAMGNVGRNGPWGAGAPAVGRGVAGVGNIINTETPILHIAATYSVDGSSTKTPFGWHAGLPPFPEAISLPLVATSNSTNVTNDACRPFPAGTDFSNVVPLVRIFDPRNAPNACQISDKVKELLAAKARYVMFYSPTAATAVMDGTFPEPGLIGTGEVPAAQGEAWVNLLNNGHQVVVNIVPPSSADRVIHTVPNNQTGGLMAPHSSWGLSMELDVKPQFSAPGQNIVSTWLLSQGGYQVQSGTSMATPLVAAVYALLAEARGTHDPATLSSLLSSTAQPVHWHDDRTVNRNILAPVAQQGAGLIQAFDAAFATTTLNVSSFAFNDTDHFVPRAAFTITNNGTSEATYNVGHVPAATIYGSNGASYLADPDAFEMSSFPPELANSFASIGLSPSSVVLAPGDSATIIVTPTPPSALDPGRLPWYSGYITINSTSSATLRIPYAGVLGSLYSAPGLYTANSTTFPGYTYLAVWDMEPLPPAENLTFIIPRPTGQPNGPLPPRDVRYPAAATARKLGSKIVRLDIVPLEVFNGAPLNTTNVLGVEIAGSAERYPMRYVYASFNSDAFTGMLSDGRVVPEGRYRFWRRTLKVFGDEAKVEDWNTEWVGEGFEVRYRD